MLSRDARQLELPVSHVIRRVSYQYSTVYGVASGVVFFFLDIVF